MRYVFGLWMILFCNSFACTAQVLPTSSGSCGVGVSGVMGCSWISAIKLRKLGGQQGDVVLRSQPEFFVTRFTLSPGAPMSPRLEGQDVIVVGMSNGELVNEASSPRTNVNVSKGSVILMPAKEHYLLRNIGKEDVQLLLIELRR
jgi:mannose-6-phosphate isomerase-like protein (cupin superfamily)